MYRVTLKQSAAKEAKKLPNLVQSKIKEGLFKLAADPRPVNCKKLARSKNAYRLRVGDYRILYTIDDPARWVSVAAIRHRKEAYR